MRGVESLFIPLGLSQYVDSVIKSKKKVKLRMKKFQYINIITNNILLLVKTVTVVNLYLCLLYRSDVYIY